MQLNATSLKDEVVFQGKNAKILLNLSIIRQDNGSFCVNLEIKATCEGIFLQ
jgi:hypothetical protein